MKCEENSTFFHSISWLSKCHLFESKRQLFLFILTISSFWKNDLSKIFCVTHIFDPFFLWMKSEINGLLLEISFFKRLPRYQVIQRNRAKLFESISSRLFRYFWLISYCILNNAMKVEWKQSCTNGSFIKKSEMVKLAHFW